MLQIITDEVAVIDEIQMIRDQQRGWAWTRALLGKWTTIPSRCKTLTWWLNIKPTLAQPLVLSGLCQYTSLIFK